MHKPALVSMLRAQSGLTEIRVSPGVRSERSALLEQFWS